MTEFGVATGMLEHHEKAAKGHGGVMRRKQKSIEVFQDLFLNCATGSRQEIRDSLRRCTKEPWRHAEEKELILAEDVMAFERGPGDDIPASGLTLWRNRDGYEVANIVPLELGELGVARYNDVLNDFVRRIVEPASNDARFLMNLGEREHHLTHWTSEEAAAALHRFSVTANKSTGSSHPADRGRWFEFIFAVQRARGRLDSDVLARWLVEVEEWPSDIAEDLVVQYEFGIALLTDYDRVA